MADPTMLRSRLLAREHLIGTFVKTPTAPVRRRFDPARY